MSRAPLAALAGALAVAALTAAVAAAAPCGPSTCAPLSSSVAGSNVLLVRPAGQSGPLVSYDLASGRIGARLPAGVLSADGRRFVAITPAGARDRIARFDARTGATISSMRLAGVQLHVGAVSATGRFAALVRGEESPDVTVVDLERGKALRTIHLVGQWAVDALSRDGRRVYLLQYDGGGGYEVRVHVAGRGLLPGAIVDKREPGPMNGLAWSSIGSRDGRFQLTLFLKSAANDETEPFVHALSLDDSVAACIDLPGGDFMASGRYALVPGPDGRTLYAANPSLGVVAAIDLASRSVVATTRFHRAAANGQVSAAFGAVSPDGATVYFTAGRGLLAYDTAARRVRGPYAAGRVAGIGVDPSGRSVLVVRRNGTIVRLDTRTGQTLQT